MYDLGSRVCGGAAKLDCKHLSKAGEPIAFLRHFLKSCLSCACMEKRVASSLFWRRSDHSLSFSCWVGGLGAGLVSWGGGDGAGVGIGGGTGG